MAKDSTESSTNWRNPEGAGPPRAARNSKEQSTDLSTIFRIVDQSVGAVRAELMGEIRALTAAMRENEAQRSMDVQNLTHALQDTPKLSEIKRDNRHTLAWAIGISIAVVALLSTVFGIGASVSTGFADHVLGVRQEQKAEQIRDQRIEQQLNQVEQLLRERSNGQPNRKSLQPPLEGNVVGNST